MSDRQKGGYSTLDSSSGVFGKGHDFLLDYGNKVEDSLDGYVGGTVLSVLAVFGVLLILSVICGMIMFAARKLSRRESPPGFYNLPPPASPYRGHINNMANNEGEIAM